MKRRIFNALILLLITAVAIQCTDLKEEPYTFVSPNNFYKNGDDLNKALTATYDAFKLGYGGYEPRYAYWIPVSVLTPWIGPDATDSNTDRYNVWYNANSPDWNIDRWGANYQIINSANIVLGRGKNIDMDESRKTRMFAEARFLRALAYFYQVRLYGGVPIPDTYTHTSEGLRRLRQSADSVYSYIINDLKFAANNLPVKSEYSEDQVWRGSRGAANAFLGKVYLTRASMNDNDEYYQKSKEYSQNVIQSGEYSLEPDFKDLWYWYNTQNKNGQESIFEIQNSYVGDHEGNHLHVNMGVNIQTTDDSLGHYMFHRYGVSFYAYQKLFTDDDYRKDVTCLTEVTLSDENNNRHFEWDPSDKGYYPGSKNWQTALPGITKYYDKTSTDHDPEADIYVMRYAEVLLNYAEAENALNGPTADATSEVDMIRNRAKMDGISTAGLTREQLADTIYTERAREFLGEGKMYYEGIRTGRLAEGVRAEYEYSHDKGINFYDQPLNFLPTQDFKWKISSYYLSANPALEQNPDNENAR